MTHPTRLVAIAQPYEVIVLDQWGVLHNGRAPYDGVVEAMHTLAGQGKRLAVLSNSGKRAAINAQRIAALGVPIDAMELTMTSGEAFWQDCKDGLAPEGPMLAITGKPDDARDWSSGLEVDFVATAQAAKSVLLMGLPEGSTGEREGRLLEEAFQAGLPVVCTNPDRASPRADGSLQVSPGALAHAYQDRGGDVIFYGKPHRPIYDRLLATLGVDAQQCLMVGDSLEHDIAGAQGVGMASAFVTSGLHAVHFIDSSNVTAAVAVLAADHGVDAPTHIIDRLS